jgi:hypothetical protein
MTIPDLMQYVDPLCGIATPYGNLFPPGSRVAAYVRSSARDGDDAIRGKLRSTLAQGLALCKSGYGDVVLVLPGHSENVSGTTGLANLVPGTTIIGLGDPRQDYAPTFTWTATTANWAIDDKNVTIAGLRLVLGGADGVSNAMSFSAAGCKFIGNRLILATSALLECTIGMTVAAGATDLLVKGNKSRGAVGVTTEVILISGAAAGVDIEDNDFQMLGSAAATGVIAGTAAATNVRILRNILHNSHASSSATISWTDVAATGFIDGNRSLLMADGVAASTGIVLAGVTNNRLKCGVNYTTDEPGKSGVLSPAACAT